MIILFSNKLIGEGYTPCETVTPIPVEQIVVPIIPAMTVKELTKLMMIK